VKKDVKNHENDSVIDIVVCSLLDVYQVSEVFGVYVIRLTSPLTTETAIISETSATL
jgi:hypothetical protein